MTKTNSSGINWKNPREVKGYHKEYCQRPEVKEHRKEYNQRPEVKEHRKEYNQRPEVKEHKKEYDQEYNQRPEVKERRKEKQKYCCTFCGGHTTIEYNSVPGSILSAYEIQKCSDCGKAKTKKILMKQVRLRNLRVIMENAGGMKCPINGDRHE